MKTVILHIGSPKTATKFIQSKVLMSLHREGQIIFWGKNNSDISQNVGFPMLSQLIKQEKEIDDFVASLSDLKINIISDESFSTSWPTLNFPVKTESYSPKFVIPQLLKQFLKFKINLHVIYCIRDPRDLILSEYAQGYGQRYSWISSTSNLSAYVKELCYSNSHFAEMFKFCDIIQSMENILGSDNIHIIPYSKEGTVPEFVSVVSKIARKQKINLATDRLKNSMNNTSFLNQTKKDKDVILARREWLLSFAIYLVNRFFSKQSLVEVKGKVNVLESQANSQTRPPRKGIKLLKWLDSFLPRKLIRPFNESELKAIYNTFKDEIQYLDENTK